MTESIAARVKRIIAGSVNDLFDALENSNADAVMREAIREIDRALDDVRAELGRVMAQHAQTTRHIERTRAKIDEFSSKAAFAVGQSRDDLAEAALARQIDLERQLPVLEQSSKDVAAKQSELESFMTALAGRKREMESDLAAYAEARAAAGVDAPVGTPAGAMQAADRRAAKAEQAFWRANGVDTEAKAADARSQRETATKLQELEQIERQSQVARRLAAFKATKAAG